MSTKKIPAWARFPMACRCGFAWAVAMPTQRAVSLSPVCPACDGVGFPDLSSERTVTMHDDCPPDAMPVDEIN